MLREELTRIESDLEVNRLEAQMVELRIAGLEAQRDHLRRQLGTTFALDMTNTPSHQKESFPETVLDDIKLQPNRTRAVVRLLELADREVSSREIRSALVQCGRNNPQDGREDIVSATLQQLVGRGEVIRSRPGWFRFNSAKA